MNDFSNMGITLQDLIVQVKDHTAETLVLTANNRLGRFLRYRLGQTMFAEGAQCWDRPSVMTLNAWLRSVWQEWQRSAACGDDDRRRMLLSREQETWLWKWLFRQYLAQDGSRKVMMIDSAAEDAAEAWAMLNDACVEIDKLDAAIENAEKSEGNKPPPYHLFAELIEIQQRYCAKKMITLSDVAYEVCTNPKILQTVGVPQNVILAGFDRLLDANAKDHTRIFALREALGRAGKTVSEYYAPLGARTPQKQIEAGTYGSLKAELKAAAAWARELWQNKGTSEGLRIGIVVPNLQNSLTDVETIFTETLFPQVYGMADGEKERRKYFNISYSYPLAQHPAIIDGLAFLRFYCTGNHSDLWVPYETASKYLRSPWFARGAEDQTRDLSREKKMRTCGRPHYNFFKVMGFNSQIDFKEKKSPREWGDVFKSAWERFGYLKNALSRVDLMPLCLQLQRDLSAAFLKLPEYDIFGDWSKVTASEAIDLLEKTLRSMSFQQAGGDGAPVQVVGLIEAMGLEFTHLWVCGLDDTNWPRQTKLNPFLTPALQRWSKMPYSTPQWCYDHAERCTEILARQASKRMILSAPLSGPEGTDLCPSTLLSAYAGAEKEPHENSYSDTIFDKEMERWKDLRKEEVEDAKHVLTDEESAIKGGATIFKDSAECPFRAYVKTRFGNPQGVPKFVYGIDALTWGNLYHAILEKCWRELRTGKTLAEKDSDAVKDMVSSIVADELIRCQAEHYLTNEAYLGDLKGYFEKLVSDTVTRWLENKETNDPPFEIMILEGWGIDEEQDPDDKVKRYKEVTVGTGENSIKVNLKIDRVDKLLNDGSLRVVDYKTGSGEYTKTKLVPSKPKDGEAIPGPIAEPQLALYAYSLNGQVTTLSIAQLNARKMGFVSATIGENKSETPYSNIKASLENMAADIRAGVTEINDKKCRYCEFGALCRRNEKVQDMSTSEGEYYGG